MDYDLPDVIQVKGDGPVRIVTFARPDHMNAVNDELHRGLANLFPPLSADRARRPTRSPTPAGACWARSGLSACCASGAASRSFWPGKLSLPPWCRRQAARSKSYRRPG